MVKQKVQRFDIWLVQLDPTQGSEIKKTRPSVVISPDEMSSLKTAIVAPMTSKGFSFPTRIQCTFQGKQGLVLLDQMRAVDKSRLIQKLGVISKSAQIKVINCLQELFAY
ncbi:MAG: type II toxin-antitoxin system PemK/MazF family toxin [Proteobacteria bacterium]|nr:type II toxin-antitoxin system PemK/MazF family toxin [Pseudomonadota bacterium]MBU4009968.1 type II toxin-antitoxin system PemK/MazF family toxin [Pseudomonadota bacterium]MBU4035526.1 type II toxin-antitoxin system PemK/MazF family toxin [Pseudomonadota bacterium]